MDYMHLRTSLEQTHSFINETPEFRYTLFVQIKERHSKEMFSAIGLVRVTGRVYKDNSPYQHSLSVCVCVLLKDKEGLREGDRGQGSTVGSV